MDTSVFVGPVLAALIICVLIVSWLYRTAPVAQRAPQWMKHDLEKGTVTPVDIDKPPVCTYCGGTEFFNGPSGGMSTNIMCAEPSCGHWFNHSPFGMDDLHEIGASRRSSR